MKSRTYTLDELVEENLYLCELLGRMAAAFSAWPVKDKKSLLGEVRAALEK